MSSKKKSDSPLDEALASALNDKKFANFFYDTFLNTVIFLPVRKEGTEEGSGRELAMNERFFPLYLSFEKGKALPVFDSLERLQTWAPDKTFDYLKIKAHLLLKILDPSMALVLNAGTEAEYILTSEILDLLRNSMRPVSPT